jgi:peptidoglycan/LPS O-acetylase OafA/YrhL
MLVIGAHSVTMLRNSHTAVGELAAKFLDHAGIGVDLFFAISGYLICTLLLKEKASGHISLGRFYTRRVFRIMPPVAAYLAVLVALKLSSVLPQITYFELAAVGLFVRNYVEGTWYTLHFWSLAVEEHFYIFVPVMIAALTRRSILVVAILVVVAACVARIVELRFALGAAVYLNTECRIDAIMYGAILALVLNEQVARQWLRDHLTLFSLTAVLFVSALVIATFPSLPVRRTVVALMMPLPIAYTVLRPHEFLGRLLELPAARWLGRLSYSLYVWQMLFLTNQARSLGELQSFPFAFFSTMVCAVACHYLIEKPAIKIGHRIASSQR